MELHGLHEPLPFAMGNEEEFSLRFRLKGQPIFQELSGFDHYFFLATVFDGERKPYFTEFRDNGARVYPGDSIMVYGSDTVFPRWTLPESATPECRSPRELTASIFANEEYIIRMVSRYISAHNKHAARGKLDTMIDAAILQRRAVDSVGNTIGIHDNIDVSKLSEAQRFVLGSVMVAHSVTRPFISGAGVQTEQGFRYSQKLGDIYEMFGVTDLPQKTTLVNYKGDRLELRSADPNISQWATWMRVGSEGLITAMAAVPALAGKMAKLAEPLGITPDNVNDLAQRLNDPEDIDALRQAYEFQLGLAKMAALELPNYLDPTMQLGRDMIASDYLEVADNWMNYLQVFDAYLRGDSGALEHLSVMSDWARKLRYMNAYFERMRDKGELVDVEDPRVRQLDLGYDTIIFKPNPDGEVDIVRGIGLRRRHEDDKKSIVTKREIDTAMRKPPETRAALRVEFLDFVHALEGVTVKSTDFEGLIVGLGREEFTFTLNTDPSAVVLDDENKFKLIDLLLKLNDFDIDLASSVVEQHPELFGDYNFLNIEGLD